MYGHDIVNWWYLGSWLSLCNSPRVIKATWIQIEDLCVIVADRGISGDHLPNSVMGACKECRQQDLTRIGEQHEQAYIDVRRQEMYIRYAGHLSA